MIITLGEFSFAGVLGKSVRSYQKTVRLKAGELPWDYFIIAVSYDALLSFSFDGKFYGEDVIVRSGTSFQFAAVVKAIRIRVKRNVHRCGYSLELLHKAVATRPACSA